MNGFQWVLGPWLTLHPFLFETLIFTSDFNVHSFVVTEVELHREGNYFVSSEPHSSKDPFLVLSQSDDQLDLNAVVAELLPTRVATEKLLTGILFFD